MTFAPCAEERKRPHAVYVSINQTWCIVFFPSDDEAVAWMAKTIERIDPKGWPRALEDSLGNVRKAIQAWQDDALQIFDYFHRYPVRNADEVAAELVATAQATAAR